MCSGLRKPSKPHAQIDATPAAPTACFFTPRVPQAHTKGRLESRQEMPLAFICGSSHVIAFVTSSSISFPRPPPECETQHAAAEGHFTVIAVYAHGDDKVGSHHFALPRIYPFNMRD